MKFSLKTFLNPETLEKLYFWWIHNNLSLQAIMTFAKAMMVLPLKSEEIKKEEGHLGQCFGIGNDKMETKN